MGETCNKYDYQKREYRFRSQKREHYLSQVRKIDSMNPNERTFYHLTYKDFLIRKISRVEKLMSLETTVVI